MLCLFNARVAVTLYLHAADMTYAANCGAKTRIMTYSWPRQKYSGTRMSYQPILVSTSCSQTRSWLNIVHTNKKVIYDNRRSTITEVMLKV